MCVCDCQAIRGFTSGLAGVGFQEGRLFACYIALYSSVRREVCAEGSHRCSWEVANKEIKGMR
jgi:hypothetical protein